MEECLPIQIGIKGYCPLPSIIRCHTALVKAKFFQDGTGLPNTDRHTPSAISKFSRIQWAALSRHHSHPGTPNINYSLLDTSEHIDPPRCAYAHVTRFHTVPAPAALPAPAPAPHKLHTPAPTKSQPLPPLRHHPIGLPKCKCTCALSVAPNRCTNGTPPLQAGFAALVLAPAVTHCTFLIVIPATPFRQPTSTFKT